MNDVQKLQLERAKIAFEPKVAEGLVAYEHLWDAFVVGRFNKYHTLIELRDLKDGGLNGGLNADTIMIITDLKRAQELMTLAFPWGAQKFGYNGRLADGSWIACGTHPHRNYDEMQRELGGFDDSDDDDHEPKDFVIMQLWWD